MCVICYKEKGKKMPSVKDIIDMWTKNPDGAGLMWLNDNGKVGFKKGFMSRKSITRFIRKHEDFFNERDVALHFRITTHGGTSRGNTHPFVVDMDANPHALEGEADTVLMHNGMLSINPRFETISDSAELALRAGCYERPLFYLETIDEFLEGSRILVFDKDGAHFYGDKFVEHDGLKYSNLNHIIKKNPYYGYRYGTYYYNYDSPEGEKWKSGSWVKSDDGRWVWKSYDTPKSQSGSAVSTPLTANDKEYLDKFQGALDDYDYGF